MCFWEELESYSEQGVLLCSKPFLTLDLVNAYVSVTSEGYPRMGTLSRSIDFSVYKGIQPVGNTCLGVHSSCPVFGAVNRILSKKEAQGQALLSVAVKIQSGDRNNIYCILI